mmetsp:Transcript_22073/g.28581  ORF Transcript_22073/g.28581 Transcript_22073/m.28581 type:complete len:625 (-) Transcript_22073:229-2103(-)
MDIPDEIKKETLEEGEEMAVESAPLLREAEAQPADLEIMPADTLDPLLSACASPLLEEELPDYLCEECEEHDAQFYCPPCQGRFCEMCFKILHRKGRRAEHQPETIEGYDRHQQQEGRRSRQGSSSVGEGTLHLPELPTQRKQSNPQSSTPRAPIRDLSRYALMSERAKYIPMRLSYEERKFLRLLEGALQVSNYTGAVDRDFAKGEAQRMHTQLQQITSMLCGMATGLNYEVGQELAEERNFKQHEEFYQDAFEIGRRYKIMNPQRMRGEYGKMAYMLQDAQKLQSQLELSCIRPITTVYRTLEEGGALAMLEDPNIEAATDEILPDPTKTRQQIQSMIKRKNRLVENFAKTFSSKRISADTIRLCLYSISDNKSYLNSNRLPIDRMLRYLETHFRPEVAVAGYDLSVTSGEDGARLTHSHERHYHFIHQSLYLWREIVNDMFRLWTLAEEDLLDPNQPCELTSTGQGLQRVQQCPRTYKAMQEILYCTQLKLKDWVGSSVIHLGDHNVPNALTFIDKYAQVSLILGPIVNCLDVMEKICKEDEGIKFFIDRFGGPEKLKKDILYDFFRSAFDGSGGDNFFEAGSCIDGRLTSAWNWCQQLSQKPYYRIFKLTGFSGFDGDFK